VSRPRSIRPRKAPRTQQLATAVSVCLEAHELWQRMTTEQRTQVRGLITQIADAFATAPEGMIVPAKTAHVLDLRDLEASGIIRKKSKSPLR
jgi:hypothetical protein